MFYAFCWREEVAGEKHRVKEEEEEDEEAWWEKTKEPGSGMRKTKEQEKQKRMKIMDTN